MNEEWKRIVEFNNKHFPDWRNRHPIYYSNAMAGEVGKICGGIKWLVGGGTKKKQLTKTEIATEFIDVFIYGVLLLGSLGLDYDKFKELFLIKMKVLEGRMGERI